MILNYQLYRETRFFFIRIIEKIYIFSIYSEQECYSRFFLESLLLHVSFKFHSAFKIVLITGIMRMCVGANKY